MDNIIHGEPLRVVMLISTPKQAEKAKALFHKNSVPILYQMSAHGTATKEILDLLGLGDPEKTVLISMLPKQFADKMLVRLNDELRLNTTNSGIAFTFPLTGGSSLLLKKVREMQVNDMASESGEDVTSMTEMKYAMIAVVANQGFSEDVMAAARSAGAVGGTVLPSRRVVNEETMKFWSFSLQPEEEIILILTTEEHKMGIMQAVNANCGVHSEAKAIVLSIPVDSVSGLNKPL